MINRIHRIQGQLNGVIIISENLVECVKMSEENSEDSQALINEAVALLIKSK